MKYIPLTSSNTIYTSPPRDYERLLKQSREIIWWFDDNPNANWVHTGGLAYQMNLFQEVVDRGTEAQVKQAHHLHKCYYRFLPNTKNDTDGK